MNESGWIFKATDSEDKRILRIHLTEKAKGLKNSLTEERKLANEEILRDLSLEETIIIKRLLRDMQA
jgi:DNA-binding MarR family transcriptional regulator